MVVGEYVTSIVDDGNGRLYHAHCEKIVRCKNCRFRAACWCQQFNIELTDFNCFCAWGDDSESPIETYDEDLNEIYEEDFIDE